MTKRELLKKVSENSGLNIVDVEINDTIYGKFKCREFTFLTLHRKYKVAVIKNGQIIDIVGRLARNYNIEYDIRLFEI